MLKKSNCILFSSDSIRCSLYWLVLITTRSSIAHHMQQHKTHLLTDKLQAGQQVLSVKTADITCNRKLAHRNKKKEFHRHTLKCSPVQETTVLLWQLLSGVTDISDGRVEALNSGGSGCQQSLFWRVLLEMLETYSVQRQWQLDVTVACAHMNWHPY